ncbi:hypothetical protein LQD23_16285 [Chromobacterium violaceum]|uniref:hypothetical protein n=1 Tax=Chromobacterium violaceum TaxID=536 RepID=UPI001E3A63E0|nr:hypothetical protein [Chromobacterium violaceum]MCD0493840.1 hypothetical protein [Chromobacterium violaceum]
MEHTKQAAVAWAVTGTQHDGRRYLELREDEKTAQALTDGIRRWHPGCDVEMRPLVYGDVPRPALLCAMIDAAPQPDKDGAA